MDDTSLAHTACGVLLLGEEEIKMFLNDGTAGTSFSVPHSWNGKDRPLVPDCRLRVLEKEFEKNVFPSKIFPLVKEKKRWFHSGFMELKTDGGKNSLFHSRFVALKQEKKKKGRVPLKIYGTKKQMEENTACSTRDLWH